MTLPPRCTPVETRMKSVSYLCIALLFTPIAKSQTVTRGDWATVQSLTPGRRVQVHRFGTDRVDGPFRSASADSIVVGTRTGDRTVSRTEIREVKLRKASGRLKNGAVGAAVGGGLGAGLGLAITRGDLEDLGAAILAFLTVVGASAGFGLGLIAPGYGTVYKADQR